MMTWKEIDESELEDEAVTMSEILEEFKEENGMSKVRYRNENSVLFRSLRFWCLLS